MAGSQDTLTGNSTKNISNAAGGSGISRRGFITRMGGGLLAANVAGAFLKDAAAELVVPDPPGKKLGWAIVGLGSLSINQILPAFAKCEKSKVVAFVSGHPDKANKLALRYGVNPKNIYNYQNYDSIKDNPEVDVIYIVLPNGMHAEYTVRGLQAGKHVLSEKPMANTPAECQQMIDAARKADRKLMVAYRCRYEPYNQEAIRIARSSELGKTQVIVSDHGFNIGDPTQWRLNKKLAGGGCLMDIGIYALQAARYLSGEEPVEINAMTYSDPNDPRFKEVEETINFQLRFPSGILANCTSSYGYAGQNHYRVVGTEGWLDMEPATSYSGLRMHVHRKNITEEIELPVRDHFQMEMDHMSACVMENREPLTPGEEGLRDLTIMMGIYEAARSGKMVKL
ncbi:MAG TPA: Gfo/Idh/MocA family oxidoreductase [Terriglobales bacterium]|nr:Gfo/Idh/MocA family oxidoreductase [Terriglobales bacterium]